MNPSNSLYIVFSFELNFEKRANESPFVLKPIINFYLFQAKLVFLILIECKCISLILFYTKKAPQM
ncbi:MAG: hypothetical protein B7Y83_10930 [Flavobacteriales bacterium 32-34-25]|nr:MAG: hypothetical protein B7Y83_10930 [Flavobacteriales bacterium 32-34-25]